MTQQGDKQAAAIAAAAEVEPGMLVGLGTGSTAAFLIDELARRMRQDDLRFRAVATSRASEQQAVAAGIEVLPFEAVAAVDLTVDGADEIDPGLRAIKGAGGAMLREKIVATASRRMVAIADSSKLVAQLGAAPVPVEVLPFARSFVAAKLRALGAAVTLRKKAGATVSTDGGNLILDCGFGPIADPDRLGQLIAAIPGALGHGLFLDEIDAIYVARDGIATCRERGDPPAD